MPDLPPAHAGLLVRQCGRCAHLWYRAAATPGNLCGKECVRQQRCVDARDTDGDCGPEGRHFLECPV